MKKMILAVAAVFAFTLSTNAQSEGNGPRQMPSQEEMIQHQTDMMADSLGLTASQKEALLALNTEYSDQMRPQMPPRRMDSGNSDESTRPEPPSREDMDSQRQAMQEARENYNTELKKILTDEQYAKYEQMQKQMPRGGHRGGGPRGGGPGNGGPRGGNE